MVDAPSLYEANSRGLEELLRKSFIDQRNIDLMYELCKQCTSVYFFFTTC